MLAFGLPVMARLQHLSTITPAKPPWPIQAWAIAGHHSRLQQNLSPTLRFQSPRSFPQQAILDLHSPTYTNVTIINSPGFSLVN